MVVRVSLGLIAGLCALFVGCEEQEKPQQDSALQNRTVPHSPVPDSGLKIAARNLQCFPGNSGNDHEKLNAAFRARVFYKVGEFARPRPR